MLVHFAFLNNLGVLRAKNSVDVPELPNVGSFIVCQDIPDSWVMHVFLEKPPEDILKLLTIEDIPFDFSLPLIVCSMPDDWDPMESSSGHTLQ